MIGGMGRPVGGITGGGGNGIILGRLTSSTMRGSLPWSNGQRSPRTQNPFSVEKNKHQHFTFSYTSSYFRNLRCSSDLLGTLSPDTFDYLILTLFVNLRDVGVWESNFRTNSDKNVI